MRDELLYDNDRELVYTMDDKLDPDYLDSLEYFSDPYCHDDMGNEGVGFIYHNDDRSASLYVVWKDDVIVTTHRITN